MNPESSPDPLQALFQTQSRDIEKDLLNDEAFVRKVEVRVMKAESTGLLVRWLPFLTLVISASIAFFTLPVGSLLVEGTLQMVFSLQPDAHALLILLVVPACFWAVRPSLPD